MPTEKEKTDAVTRNHYSYTAELRRIAKVAHDETRLKAELAQLVVGKIAGMHNFLDTVIIECYLLSPVSIKMLNDRFSELMSVAVIGILCSEEIKESKEKILTHDSFLKFILKADNQDISNAIQLMCAAIKEGIHCAFKYYRNHIEENVVYIDGGKLSLDEVHETTIKAFFDLYYHKMEIKASSQGSSYLFDVTCPGLRVHKSDVIFELYKKTLLKLVENKEHKYNKTAVINMIDELDLRNNDGASRIRPASILILANAVKLLKSTEQVDDAEGVEKYDQALTAYTKSVEALKTSKGIAQNKKRSMILACTTLALLAVLVVSAIVCATVICGFGWVAMLAIASGIAFLCASQYAAGKKIMLRKSACSLHSLESRFKHTTLFSNVFSKAPAEPHASNTKLNSV